MWIHPDIPCTNSLILGMFPGCRECDSANSKEEERFCSSYSSILIVNFGKPVIHWFNWCFASINQVYPGWFRLLFSPDLPKSCPRSAPWSNMRRLHREGLRMEQFPDCTGCCGDIPWKLTFSNACGFTRSQKPYNLLSMQLSHWVDVQTLALWLS